MELSTTYNPTSAYRSNLAQPRPLQPEGPAADLREPSATSSSDPDSRKDTVSIGSKEQNDGHATYSPQGLLNGEEQEATVPGQDPEASETEDETSAEAEKSEAERKPDGQEYTREEQEKITKLKDRDREVRAHEQAHVAAGGQYVRGAAQFQYQSGPDGQRYAVGGEVSIDVSRESGDPEATAAKMQVVIRAALAPAEPSGQDRAVAAQAVRTASEARMEAAAESGATAREKAGLENTEDPATKTEDKALPAQNTGIDLFA